MELGLCIKLPLPGGLPSTPCTPRHWNLVDLLLENNADKTIRNKEGKTAAMMANADLSDYLNGGGVYLLSPSLAML